jgi:hypothetical protein
VLFTGFRKRILSLSFGEKGLILTALGADEAPNQRKPLTRNKSQHLWAQQYFHQGELVFQIVALCHSEATCPSSSTICFRLPGSSSPFADNTMLDQGLHDTWAIYTNARDRQNRASVIDEEMANQQVQLSFGVQDAIVQGQFELSFADLKPVSRMFHQQFYFFAHKDAFLNRDILRESPQTFMSRF